MEEARKPIHHKDGNVRIEPYVGDTAEWHFNDGSHFGTIIGVVYATPGFVSGGCTTLVVQCEKHTYPCTVKWGHTYDADGVEYAWAF